MSIKRWWRNLTRRRRLIKEKGKGLHLLSWPYINLIECDHCEEMGMYIFNGKVGCAGHLLWLRKK